MALTDPPSDLHAKRLPLIPLPRHLIRLNLKKYIDPLHWSKRGDYRFDSPTAKYGVFYTSADVQAAILEVFGDHWLITRQLRLTDLDQYEVCEIEIGRPFLVINTAGKQLNRLGTDSNFFATTDYATTQNWARALMTHPQKPSGIRYNSRKNPRRINYALFGTAEAKSTTKVLNRYPLVHYPSLFRFLLSYDVSII